MMHVCGVCCCEEDCCFFSVGVVGVLAVDMGVGVKKVMILLLLLVFAKYIKKSYYHDNCGAYMVLKYYFIIINCLHWLNLEESVIGMLVGEEKK